MLSRFKRMMGSKVDATDGSLGNAIRFFVDEDDWSVPLMMVGGGRATTGELMMPTRLVEVEEGEETRFGVPVLRRSIMSSGSAQSDRRSGVFDALRLMGARATARGKPIGKVVDLMVEPRNPWSVRYLVVETDETEPGEEVLMSTEWITSFSIEEKRVDLDVERDDVPGCPRCNLEESVEREYEMRLHEHYDRPVYWGRMG